MFTIALIGPDGAGKTAISRRIIESIPLRVKYLYMGVNVDSSNRMLPTTRLAAAFKRASGRKIGWKGPPIPTQKKSAPSGIFRRVLGGLRSGLRLGNRLGEEGYRQCLTWLYLWQGYMVLYDRHFFFDYYAYDIAPQGKNHPLSRRIHGFFLQNIYPKPDLVIFLDAPAEVLFSRKGEGTIEDLERRRKEYLQAGEHVPHFIVVDATQSMEQVTNKVADVILNFDQARKNKRAGRFRQTL
jgi:thymidylate kinase